MSPAGGPAGVPMTQTVVSLCLTRTGSGGQPSRTVSANRQAVQSEVVRPPFS